MSNRYGLEIRAAGSADAPRLSELFAAAGRPVAARALADRLQAIGHGPAAALMALEWGPPSGVVLLHWYPTLAGDLPTAQITMLLVAPDDRRRGIGRLLVKAASQAARVAGCGALELVAGDADPALQSFCQATGFAPAGTRFTRMLRKSG